MRDIVQRPIRFRAWDKERKQMRYQDKEFFRIGLRHGKEGNEFWKDLSMSVDNFYTPEQGEIMQYTGLKDKNGVEIYEGDRVTFLHTEGRQRKPRQIYGEVVYSPSFLGFYVVDENNRGIKALSDAHPLEVTGNIWK